MKYILTDSKIRKIIVQSEIEHNSPLYFETNKDGIVKIRRVFKIRSGLKKMFPVGYVIFELPVYVYKDAVGIRLVSNRKTYLIT